MFPWLDSSLRPAQRRPGGDKDAGLYTTRRRAKHRKNAVSNRLMKFTAGTSLALAMTAVAVGQQYTQINLVSNTAGTATTTDASLVNSWGISRGPTGNWWVSDNVTGVATLYAGAGVKNSLTVTIPPQPQQQTVQGRYPHRNHLQ
jgi:hypothetical protein